MMLDLAFGDYSPFFPQCFLQAGGTEGAKMLLYEMSRTFSVGFKSYGLAGHSTIGHALSCIRMKPYSTVSAIDWRSTDWKMGSRISCKYPTAVISPPRLMCSSVHLSVLPYQLWDLSLRTWSKSSFHHPPKKLFIPSWKTNTVHTSVHSSSG